MVAALLLAILILVSPAGTAWSQASSGHAAMFRGGPAHQGVYPAAGAHFIGIQWRLATEGPVFSSPAVHDGSVYVGSADGRLYAAELKTGTLRWAADLASPVASSPAVVEGLVFAATRDGRLHAVDARSGKTVWGVATGADRALPWGHESGDLYLSSPTASGDLVVFGSGDGRLYAFDRRSGKERWRAETGGRIRSTPAIANGRVFVGSGDGRVYCFDLERGTAIWRYDTEGASLESGKFGYDRRTVQSSPAVSGGTVFVGARDGFLYAISADSGRLRWRFDHKISWVNSSPAVLDGTVFAGSSDGQFVHAVDAASGTERWRTPVEGAIVWSSPAVAGDVVLFGDGMGRVHAVDRASGAPRWRFFTGAAVFSSPVVADGVVLIGSGDGGLYALRTGATGPIERAVYFDSTLTALIGAAERGLAGFLTGRGYARLDDQGLESFLTQRIADRRPSVVVFAMEHLPAAVAGDSLERSLLRRYLDSGGKVVWAGAVPPLLWPRDPKTGARPGLLAVTWPGPERLLGVSHQRAIFDRRGTRPTDAGRRWGLTGWWRDAWGVDPAVVTEVLALDEWGLASTWVRSYDGPPGTGFVRAGSVDPAAVYLLAEFRPGTP